MPDLLDFSKIELDALARSCQEETWKYVHQQFSVPGYCFELLCRACRDQDDNALTHVFAIYLPQLESRVRRHPMFYLSCQDTSLLGRTALINFFYAVRAEKFLQKFSSLGNVLAYMWTCVHTSVMADIRNNPRHSQVEEENIVAPPAPSKIEQRELLSHIYEVLSPEDRLLFYARFVLEMKPAEIVSAYPHLWSTPRQVSVQLQKIRRRLRADPYLRSMSGLTDADDDDGDDDNNE